MTTFRAYGNIPPGTSGLFRVGDTPRHGRKVVSYARGLHYPEPYRAPDGWRCRTCLRKLREYQYRGAKRLRHARSGGVE